MRFPVFALCASALFAAFGSVTKARMNDIPGTAYVVTDVTLPASIGTNDVCAIVTNTVPGGWSEWEWSDGKTHKDPEYLADAEEPKWMMDLDEAWAYGIGELVDGGADSTRLVFGEYDNTGFLLVATRRWIKGANALGLAMAKDVVSAEAATNVARAVSNSFWDDKNEVLWRLEFRDGEPMFVPVTNENVKATGGVL